MKYENQPDVRITVTLPGSDPVDVTLSYPLRADQQQMLHMLREMEGGLKGVIECRMHDHDYRLRDLRDADGRVRGVWLNLRKHPGDPNRLLFAHWPGSGVTGTHLVPTGKSPEHCARQEYIALRADSNGYEVQLEKSVAPGTVSDVVIRGAFTMTAEVQVSGIKDATVLKRTRRATAAGANPVWFAGTTPPGWEFKAPTVLTNPRIGMDPRQWTVTTGPRSLEWERCGPTSRLAKCPDGNWNWCGKWHPLWRPIHGLTVDDVVEKVPGGGLVRVDTSSRQGTFLTTPADRQAWLDHFGTPNLPQQQRVARPGGMNHSSYDVEKIRARAPERARYTVQQDKAVAQPEPAETPARPVSPAEEPQACPRCQRPTVPAIVRALGHCLACPGANA